MLVVALIVYLKRRNGSNGQAKTPEPGVQYFQLATLITNLHDLARDIAERDRAREARDAERERREEGRHSVVMTSLGLMDKRQQDIHTIVERRSPAA